jgi:hypothetical protein
MQELMKMITASPTMFMGTVLLVYILDRVILYNIIKQATEKKDGN